MSNINHPNIATLASNIKQGIEAKLKDLHTSTPGIIQAVDYEKQLLTVQPAVRRVFITRDGNTEILAPQDLPVLINVPMIFPRGGGFSLTFPVAAGDECLLVFCERSIDNWHNTGKIKQPIAKRFHSLSDAVALVGLSSIPNKIPNYNTTDVELKKDDNSAIIRIKADTGIRMENTNGFVELQQDGKFNINGVIFDDHFHNQDNDSDGDSQQATEFPES